MMAILQEENKLMEIVKLIGSDVLPEEQKLIIGDCEGDPRWDFCSRTHSTRRTPTCPWIKQREMMKVIALCWRMSGQKLVAACGSDLRNRQIRHIFDRLDTK